MDEDGNEMQCQKLLWDLYSSEMNTHGILIIGFLILLFAIVQIRINLMVASNMGAFQSRILYFGFFVVGLALYYLFFRYISYGTLAHYTILTPWKEPVSDKTKVCNIESLRGEVSKHVRQEAGFKWLIRYFMKSTREGFAMASLLSLLTTFSFDLVLAYSDLMLVLTVFLFLASLGFCLFLFSKRNRE